MQFLKHSAMIPQDKRFSINNQVKAQSDKNISDLGKKNLLQSRITSIKSIK